MPELRARLAVSASQLKDFDRCERAWYLASVARAPDDANAGGQYLVQGDLFDEAVQRQQARMGVDAGDLVSAVRAKPGLRGAALSLPEEDWGRLAERAQRMLRVVEHHLPPPKTARIQHRYRVLVPGFEAYGGVVVTGKTDLRQPGLVWDTKSTTDRGPGRGRDADTPPYALTDEHTPGGNVRPLADDVQARLYAWCEFATDPLRLSVRCVWVYASKPSSGSPQGWAVEHTFLRAETLAWFESYARPRIERMLALDEGSELELAPERARANHDGCLRCFRRLACSPFSGAQHEPHQEGAVVGMAIDWKAKRAAQAANRGTAAVVHTPAGDRAETDLEAALRASLVADAAAVATGLGSEQAEAIAEREASRGVVVAPPAAAPFLDVAVNRPDAPPNPHAAPPATPAPAAPPAPAALAVLDVEGVSVESDASTQPPAAATAEPAPRRGRGRPRKSAATEPVAHAPVAELTSEQVEALATAAQAVADAADSFVQRCNAVLRARGVRV